jgi:chromosome segregation ATPase
MWARPVATSSQSAKAPFKLCSSRRNPSYVAVKQVQSRYCKEGVDMKRIAVTLIMSLGLLVACNGSDQVTTLTQERDALLQERDTIVRERDAIVQERDTLTQERDALQQQVSDLEARVGTLETERDGLQSELTARTQELEESRQELLERTVERDEILAELQAEFEGSLESVRSELQDMASITETIEAEREQLREGVDEDILPPLDPDPATEEAGTVDGRARTTEQVERLHGRIEQLERQADQR